MKKNDKVIVVSGIHMYYAKVLEVGEVHTIVESIDGVKRNPLTSHVFKNFKDAIQQQINNYS